MAGWETRALGELCEFQRGLTYGKSDEVDVSNNVVLRANNVDLATHTLDLSDLRYISDSVSVPATKKVRKGSLLICTASGSKSHLGKIAYVDDDYGYAFGGFMGQITPAPGVNDRYLFHALTSPAYKGFIEALSDGVNINNLKFDDLRQFPVPVPPVAEQRRIVAILDEAFEGIATVKTNAERNLQNARELFQGTLANIFSQSKSGWLKRPLGRVTTKIGSGATPLGGEDAYKEYGISLVRSLNVYDDGFRFAKLAHLDDEQAARLSNVEVQPEDVLLNITGASVARCCVVPTEVLPARVNQHVSIIRPIRTELDAEFLHYFLIARPNKERLLGIGAEGGSTRQAITKAQIQDFVVEFPSDIDEQRSIVAAVDEIRLATQGLDAIYERKIAALDDLKKSLLDQALSGALTKKAAGRQTIKAA